MRNDYYVNSKDYINRWVVSYADFVTMLLALFMVMYAVVRIDNQPGIILSVNGTDNTNPIDASKLVSNLINKMESQQPAGMKMASSFPRH